MKAARIAIGALLCAATLPTLLFVHSLHQVVRLLVSPPDASGLSSGALAIYSLYSAFSLVASTLLLASLRLRPTLRVNLALALAFGAAALVGADVLLSPWVRSPRLRLELIQDLKRRGIRAVPPVSAYLFVRQSTLNPELPESIEVDGAALLPLGGLSRRTTVDCDEGGGWLVYESDEHGFQNPPGLWNAGGDIVAVGDSFTKGECVAPDENAVARIRSQYSATLNLGQPGNGPLTMLATLREYLPHLRPKIVLWCYFSGNDLGDLRYESQHAILSRYLDRRFRQDLFGKQTAIDRALEASLDRALASAWRRRIGLGHIATDALLLRNLRSRAATALLMIEPQLRDLGVDEEGYALFERVLREAQSEAAERGSKLYFVYLPAWAELHGESRSRDIAATRRQRVVAVVRGLEIPLIDVFSEFASAGRRELFVCPACHYSAEGYDRVARGILAALANEERLRP